MFEYPLDLHCSQTNSVSFLILSTFEYPLDLHCSQTIVEDVYTKVSLNTLWIYTALKLKRFKRYSFKRLNTLWIYTALKHSACTLVRIAV